jgi:hypothetical protein
LLIPWSPFLTHLLAVSGEVVTILRALPAPERAIGARGSASLPFSPSVAGASAFESEFAVRPLSGVAMLTIPSRHQQGQVVIRAGAVSSSRAAGGALVHDDELAPLIEESDGLHQGAARRRPVARVHVNVQ